MFPKSDAKNNSVFDTETKSLKRETEDLILISCFTVKLGLVSVTVTWIIIGFQLVGVLRVIFLWPIRRNPWGLYSVSLKIIIDISCSLQSLILWKQFKTFLQARQWHSRAVMEKWSGSFAQSNAKTKFQS